MKIMRLLLTAAIAVSTLSGCASRIKTEVTKFHALPSSTDGAKFMIIPNRDQQNSLEFKQYASLLSNQLRSKRLVEVSSLRDADYAVFLAYGIDSGTTTTSTVPLYGQTGGGATTFSGSTFGNVGMTPYNSTTTGTVYQTPSFGQIGSIPVSNTTFRRAVVLDIADVKKSSDKNLVTAYEARVLSQGKSGNLNEVMPYLIRSIFQDFPGKSGETSTVILKIEE